MPVLHLLIEKALIILPAAGDNREMVRVKRLDDNLPGRLGTAAAPAACMIKSNVISTLRKSGRAYRRRR